jgi:anti-sigma B factor antagonist
LTIAQESKSGCVHLRVTGEVDIETVPSLRERIELTQNGGSEPIVLDLTSVTFIDSTGIKVLVEVARTGRVTTIPSAAVARVLELSGLKDVVPTADDAAPA